VVVFLDISDGAVSRLVEDGFLPAARRRDVNAVRLAFGDLVEKALRRATAK
jgi:hypothetical protein